MPNRVMLDLETLGTEPGCAILSIGAVQFVPGEVTPNTFHESISISSCVEAGLEIDPGTVEWWFHVGGDAVGRLDCENDLAETLQDFSQWCRGFDEVWAYSPSFDCEILKEAYSAVGMETPWSYRDERCARTVTNLPGVDVADHDGVKHDALDDAIHQARTVANALDEVAALAE